MGVSLRRFVAKPLVSLVAVGAASAIAVWACTPDEHRHSTPTVVVAGQCAAEPGSFPTPNCSTSDNKCAPTAGCSIDEKHCGPKSGCLNFATNSGSTLDFRFRRLNVIAPPSLTYGVSPVLQTTIVNDSVSLNEKSCGEVGKGTFSWLLRFDKTSMKLTTGGAPPATDPFGKGYCFYNHLVNSGTQKLNVQPVTVPFTETDGAFASSPIEKLLVPIFLDTAGSAVIVLPLSNAIIKDVTVSADNNCIGKFNADALDPDCYDDYSTCSKWKTDGALAGFITLEDADTVFIKELSSTLCVLLSRSAPDKQCKRDSAGKISVVGDFCSTTKAAGGCKDSFWLAATFAASAVKINDGSTTPSCQAGSTPLFDAGTDAAPTDSGQPDSGQPDSGQDAANSDAGDASHD